MKERSISKVKISRGMSKVMNSPWLASKHLFESLIAMQVSVFAKLVTFKWTLAGDYTAELFYIVPRNFIWMQ